MNEFPDRALGAWRLRSKSWCRPSGKFFSTPKLFASQTFAKLCLQRENFTPLNLSLGLQKKLLTSIPGFFSCKGKREPGNEVENQSRCQTMSLQSRNISCCSFTHSQRSYGRFQDGGDFVYCSAKGREVNILVHWSDLFYSLHDALFYWFFIVAAKFFSWHDIFIRVPLLMRCNRITVILSLGFLVVVLVSANIFLLSQLQYKERFNRKETLFKVRSLGIILRVYKAFTLKDLVTNVPRAICATSSRRAGDRGRGSQQTRQPSPLEP